MEYLYERINMDSIQIMGKHKTMVKSPNELDNPGKNWLAF